MVSNTKKGTLRNSFFFCAYNFILGLICWVILSYIANFQRKVMSLESLSSFRILRYGLSVLMPLIFYWFSRTTSEKLHIKDLDEKLRRFAGVIIVFVVISFSLVFGL